MSYDHCVQHDMDATNGCPACTIVALLGEILRGPLSNPQGFKDDSRRIAAEFMLSIAARLQVSPRQARLFCPYCGKQHIDEGKYAAKMHQNHRCVDDADGKGCGKEWRLEEYLVGVAEVAG